MTNDFFTGWVALPRFGLARAEAVNAIFQAVEVGFDTLPSDANIKQNKITFTRDVSVTPNTITVTLTYPITSYLDGLHVSIIVKNTVTGATTINIDAVGAIALKQFDGTSIEANDIVANQPIEAVFDATLGYFVLVSQHGSSIINSALEVTYATEWASKAEDSLISTAAGGNGTTNYSALHHAAKAAASAVLTAADVVSTNADVVSTNADVLLTNADVLLTAADVVTTNANVVSAEAARDAAQAAAAGIYWKEPVLNRTTANVTLSGEQTIDGVLTSASRILVMNQTAAAENGIYVTAAGAWSRATPMDTWDEHIGATVNVSQGTLHADTSWICTVDAGGTLGTTDITWGSLGAVYGSASTTTEGVIELATNAEVATGTDTSRAVTPAGAASHYSPIERTTSDQTGTTYTLVIGDAGNAVLMNNASANVLTIPANADVAFAVGTQIDLVQEGAGATTVTADTGVTLNGVSAGSGTLSAQFSGATLIKRATDTWLLIGDHGGVA